MKQQSTFRHVTPLEHIFGTPSRPIFGFAPLCCIFRGEAAHTNLIIYIIITLDRPYSREAS